jgi:hypothetical protein
VVWLSCTTGDATTLSIKTGAPNNAANKKKLQNFRINTPTSGFLTLMGQSVYDCNVSGKSYHP